MRLLLYTLRNPLRHPTFLSLSSLLHYLTLLLLHHALQQAKQLESALQETKDLLVTREKEMAELRVLLSQQVRSPAPQPSSAPPTAGTITQLQLTTSREQDLQALLVAQQTIVDLRVCTPILYCLHM